MGGSASSLSSEGWDLDEHTDLLRIREFLQLKPQSAAVQFSRDPNNFMIALAALYCLRVWCERSWKT